MRRANALAFAFCAALAVFVLETLVNFGASGPVSAASIQTDRGSAGEVESAHQFVVLTNRLRASVGSTNLVVRGDLSDLACDWADQLVTEGELRHSPFIRDRAVLSGRVGTDWRFAGENVGSGPVVREIHSALVASESHYRNLVNPDFNAVGVCAKRSPDGTLFVVQEFLSARLDPPPPRTRKSNRL